jgi:serine O-acetyltransferase
MSASSGVPVASRRAMRDSPDPQPGVSMNTNCDQLWQDIRDEAAHAARDEPVLASYLHRALLSHATLESALLYNLAELLGSSVVSALTLQQVFAQALSEAPDIGVNARRDILAYHERDPACDRYLMPLLYFKGFHALQVHRSAHHLWQSGRRPLALFLQNQCSERFGVDIHPAARIGGGIMIDHATGVVIGETASVGDDVSMLHSVTLGGTGCERGDRHPKVRAGVLIAAGAQILGNIEIGAGARIGAGSLVLDPVPPGATVVGVPARIVAGGATEHRTAQGAA